MEFSAPTEIWTVKTTWGKFVGSSNSTIELSHHWHVSWDEKGLKVAFTYPNLCIFPRNIYNLLGKMPELFAMLGDFNLTEFWKKFEVKLCLYMLVCKSKNS